MREQSTVEPNQRCVFRWRTALVACVACSLFLAAGLLLHDHLREGTRGGAGGEGSAAYSLDTIETYADKELHNSTIPKTLDIEDKVHGGDQGGKGERGEDERLESGGGGGSELMGIGRI